MGQIKWGAVSRGLCAVTALLVVGCGSSDDKTSASNCGTLLKPDMFQLSNITPALGASVPNSGIVESFTLVGQLLQLQQVSLAPVTTTHTAGTPSPAVNTWSTTISASGKDTVYTSSAMTWTTPGHVELDWSGEIANQTTGCVSAFPAPVFSYDVTAP